MCRGRADDLQKLGGDPRELYVRLFRSHHVRVFLVRSYAFLLVAHQGSSIFENLTRLFCDHLKTHCIRFRVELFSQSLCTREIALNLQELGFELVEGQTTLYRTIELAKLNGLIKTSLD